MLALSGNNGFRDLYALAGNRYYLGMILDQYFTYKRRGQPRKADYSTLFLLLCMEEIQSASENKLLQYIAMGYTDNVWLPIQ